MRTVSTLLQPLLGEPVRPSRPPPVHILPIRPSRPLPVPAGLQVPPPRLTLVMAFVALGLLPVTLRSHVKPCQLPLVCRLPIWLPRHLPVLATQRGLTRHTPVHGPLHPTRIIFTQARPPAPVLCMTPSLTRVQESKGRIELVNFGKKRDTVIVICGRRATWPGTHTE